MPSPFVLKAQEELRSRRLVSPGTGNTGVDEDLPVDVLLLGELHRHDMTCRREVFLSCSAWASADALLRRLRE